MNITPLSLEKYIAECNQRIRAHPNYRMGMALIADPDTAEVAGAHGYTFTWPRESDSLRAWYDTRVVVDDVELAMREQYCLRELEAA